MVKLIAPNTGAGLAADDDCRADVHHPSAG